MVLAVVAVRGTNVEVEMLIVDADLGDVDVGVVGNSVKVWSVVNGAIDEVTALAVGTG